MNDEAVITATVDTVAAPEPVVTEAPKTVTATPEPAKLEPTPRGAVERAMAKLNEREKAAEAPKPDAQKPVETEGRERDPATGQFKAKEGTIEAPQVAKPPEAPKVQTPVSEAPSRFSADAKAAWATIPDAVKGEIHRTHRELEQGLEKYRSAATSYEEIKEYDELAKQSGTTMKAAMANYVGIERMLMKDPIAGLNQIAQNMGFSLREIAAHIMGQTPDQNASQQDATIRELRQELADIKLQVGGVFTTIQEQKKTTVVKQIEEFTAKPEHSRFNELYDEIVSQINAGHDLATAYKRAELLNPLPPAPVIAAPQTPSPDPAAHTRKGSLTVTGAPGNGSDPSAHAPSSSIRESIRNARAAVG